MSRTARPAIRLLAWTARLAWLAALLVALAWLAGQKPFTPPLEDLPDAEVRARLNHAMDQQITPGWLARELFDAVTAGEGWRAHRLLELVTQGNHRVPQTLLGRARDLPDSAAAPAGLPVASPRLAALAGARLPQVRLVLGTGAERHLHRANPRGVATLWIAALAVVSAVRILRDLVLSALARHRRRHSQRALVVAGPRISRDHER